MTNILRHNFYWLGFIVVILLFSSCSLTKRVPKDELVYLGTDIKFVDKENAKSVDKFDFTINKIPKRGTKSGLGNIYTGFYNIYEETGDKGFKHWVKYQLGKEPVLFESQMIKNTEARLTYYLTGKGFFASEIECDTSVSNRTVRMTCTVELGERYVIDTIVFPVDSTYAALKLDKNLRRVIIREGKFYDRDRLDYERMRLAKLAGSIGFANFRSENIYYYVDTLPGKHEVDIYAKVITPSDSTFHTRYTLDSIIIFPNYAINIENDDNLKRVEIKPKMEVYEKDHYLNHQLLDRLILEEPETYYNRTFEQKTINRLLDLGLFKYINIDNYPSGTGKNGRIVQEIHLTPEKIQNISGELEVNNRSGNFLGTGASVSYVHRNIFGHAERLNISLGGQVETQFGSGLSLINSSDLNINGELAFPRFIVPFFTINENKNFIPRTLVNGRASVQMRTDFYTLRNFSAKFGYRWRNNSRVLHEFYPLVINQVSVSNESDIFLDIIENDVRLQNSFEDVFIGGLQYNFTYSDQSDNEDQSYRYFRAEIETSGNVLGLFIQGTGDEPARLAGERFAQFVKLTLDYRKYFKTSRGDIATRVILGSGYSYGNNNELPYLEQYIVGGSNSLRAFRLRGLGPGATFTPEPTDPFAAQFIDQTGDIKIEMNVEYRFPLFSYLKGALFVDAGNVWLLDSETQSDGNFRFDRFYQQLGVGTGVGFRLDFDFFLIRMDIAFPLRAPVEGDRFSWLFSDIDPLSASWRSANLRYNLGIGYPF